jgi:hypothetical protein
MTNKYIIQLSSRHRTVFSKDQVTSFLEHEAGGAVSSRLIIRLLKNHGGHKARLATDPFEFKWLSTEINLIYFQKYVLCLR